MLNPEAKTAYAGFRNFAVRYDLEQHTFSCWYAPMGRVVSEAGISKVISAKGEPLMLPAEYREVSFRYAQNMDDTMLTITYRGGSDIIPELSLTFVVTQKGIRMRAEYWGDMDVHVTGKLHWGAAMETDTFAMCLDRAQPDLRSALGPASSTIDNALFDRLTDRALAFSGYGALRLWYDWNDGGYRFDAYTDRNDYVRGFAIGVAEQVYERRLDVPYRPINKQNTFPTPPCGWMTWYAVQFDASEKTVMENARWQKEHLADYGADTIWVDWEWYHSTFGGIGPEGVSALQPDPERYPEGLAAVASAIKELGLVPALWIGSSNEPAENEEIRNHPEMVLVHRPSWCGQYFFDITNEHFLHSYIPRVFGQIKEWGYQALKWDCLPITIEYADLYHDGWSHKELTSDEAFRNMVAAARNTVGEDFYMLSCSGHGERDITGAIDLFDAARIGGDIFKWSEFISQCVDRVLKFYQCHNVLHYNDPDNVVIRPKFNTYDQAVSRVTFLALLGLPVTLGDNLPDLPEDRVELLRRALPALDIHPMDIRETRRGGDLVCTNLAVERAFGRWNVVSALNLLEEEVEISLDIEADLHLEKGVYLVYDFWNRAFLGEMSGRIPLALRPCASRVLTVHRKLDRPQLLSTNRHITQGAAEITAMAWDAERSVLQGTSQVVKGDAYEMTFHVPAGWRVMVEGNDTDSAEWGQKGEYLWQVTHRPAETGTYHWSVQFGDQIAQ